MRYLSFDTESANNEPGDPSDMWEFGYAISDENFNKIEESSIRIKPKKVGDWYHIEYGWTMDEREDSPVFKDAYSEIKNLLEHPEQIIFAHSALDDLKHLGWECIKNSLNIPQIKVYDTQKIYSKYRSMRILPVSLSDTTEWSCLKCYKHKGSAAEDAKACLYIPKKIFEEMGGKKFLKILDDYEDTIVRTGDAEKILDVFEQDRRIEELTRNQK